MWTRREALEIFSDFLETVVHVLLFCRNAYPPELFERVRKYGIPIYMSRHPALNLYIADAVRSIVQMMEAKADVEAIRLVIGCEVYAIGHLKIDEDKTESLVRLQTMLRNTITTLYLMDPPRKPVLPGLPTGQARDDGGADEAEPFTIELVSNADLRSNLFWEPMEEDAPKPESARDTTGEAPSVALKKLWLPNFQCEIRRHVCH